MKKRTLPLIFASVALAVSASLLMTVAFLTDYESAAGRNYFSAGAILPTVSLLLALLSGVCGIVAAVLCEKNVLRAPLAGTRQSLPAAIACLAAAALPYPAFAWAFPVRLLLIAAALYCLFFTKKNAAHLPALTAILGFLAVAMCAVVNVYCYFDASLEMNAPVKISVQTAFLFTMLYFTGEIRYLLAKPLPRFHLVLSLTTLAALSLPMVSVPVAFAAGLIARTDYLAFSTAALGLFLTILSRVTVTAGLFSCPEESTPPSEQSKEVLSQETPASEPHDNEQKKETDEE